MAEPFHVEVYKEHVIALYYDDDAECPLEHEQKKGNGYHEPGVYFVLFDNLSTLSSYHHFNPADRGGPGEVLRFAYGKYHVFGLHGVSHTRSSYPSSFEARKAPPEWFAMVLRERLLTSTANAASITMDEEMPTYELNQWELDDIERHSERHIGFVLVKYDEHAVDKCEEALALANSVCDSVEKWCNGEFCGFAVYPKGYGIDPDTGEIDTHELDLGDAIDSCWGIDDDEYATTEAKSYVDHATKNEGEHHGQRNIGTEGISAESRP